MSDDQTPSHRSTQDIQKIAQIVSLRQRASLDEISTVIHNDATVTGPLMARAYPLTPARQTATVSMATSRVGIGYIVVLLMTDLLKQYVLETFDTMAGIPLVKDDPSLMLLESRNYLVAAIHFQGKATGTAFLVFSRTLSMLLADRFLREGEEMTLETINEAAAGIANAIGGQLEKGLGDARLPSKVEPAEISMRDTFPTGDIPGGSREEMYFRFGTHGLRVHLCVNPFSR